MNNSLAVVDLMPAAKNFEHHGCRSSVRYVTTKDLVEHINARKKKKKNPSMVPSPLGMVKEEQRTPKVVWGNREGHACRCQDRRVGATNNIRQPQDSRI
jgi:hypothetical protein